MEFPTSGEDAAADKAASGESAAAVQETEANLAAGEPALDPLVARCERTMAHAWMVRTFVKHSEESEDFPELMGIARSVFDLAMGLESRTDDPAAYFKLLGKKIGKLRKAAEQFAKDAPNASLHTNFEMAVKSMRACTEELEGAMTEWRGKVSSG